MGFLATPLPGWHQVLATTVIIAGLSAMATAAQTSQATPARTIQSIANPATLAMAALLGPALAWAVILVAGCCAETRTGGLRPLAQRSAHLLAAVQTAATAIAIVPTPDLGRWFGSIVAAGIAVGVVALLLHLIRRAEPIPLPHHRTVNRRPGSTLVAIGTAFAITALISILATIPDALLILSGMVAIGCLVGIPRLLADRRPDPGLALQGLLRALEHREIATADHSRRVTRLVDRMTSRMDELDPRDRSVILSAAAVHDIGKITTPDATLLKAGRLEPDEFATIRRHAAIGADILRQAGGSRATVDIVRHHHERWDGAGYPDGISGDRIPLGARLIAVADSYDAMTNDRTYRRALTHQVAIAEIIEQRGRQFDPAVVDLFVAVIGKQAQGVPAPTALAS